MPQLCSQCGEELEVPCIAIEFVEGNELIEKLYCDLCYQLHFESGGHC